VSTDAQNQQWKQGRVDLGPLSLHTSLYLLCEKTFLGTVTLVEVFLAEKLVKNNRHFSPILLPENLKCYVQWLCRFTPIFVADINHGFEVGEYLSCICCLYTGLYW
jgi:hypothetical protein